ncbi:MAG: AmmeMemoRadiSam system protein B [Treponema sp.]|jgi:AmmeMemoRadiSam system protein B|nr:AmmeMemoRadiSam system protein B [Treponema sp.]
MIKTAALIGEKSRAPMVSGLFYPDDPVEARERLDSFGLKQGSGGTARAIIAPHGAWDISGAVAGAAFSSAAGLAPCRVVILCTLHKLPDEGVFLSDSIHFETPLGNLPVDAGTIYELASRNASLRVNDIPHLQEHGIEVLLPFIKYCFPGASIVPVLMGGSRPPMIAALARAMSAVLEPLMESSLVVVSSNLAINADAKRGLTQAETCVEALERGGELFCDGVQQGSITACGGPAIAALLQSGLLRGKRGGLIPDTFTSAVDDEKDTVYYGGIAFRNDVA